MLNNLHSAYIILNIVILVQSEGIYNLVAPGTLHPHFKYNVALSVHRADGPCEIEIGISSSTYNTTKLIKMLPMSTENIEFATMDLEKNDYKLTIKGISGITIDNSTELNFAAYRPLVFIQTDKPIYGPGELVQFRVLFLNQYTHPGVFRNTMVIVIEDDAGNPVKIWRNIKLTHGVFTGNLQLADTPIDNVWTIKVVDGNWQLKSKLFKINKYELPKFDVSIDVPEQVAFEDEVVIVTVRSRYTFGKPVKGKAYFTIESTEGRGAISINKTIAIDGKAYIELNIWKDLPNIDLVNTNGFSVYEIYVTVEETLTGEKQRAPTTKFSIKKDNFIITADNAPTRFEPGKLITYMLTARKLDGSPLEDSKNLVELRVNDFLYYSFFNKNGRATFNFVLPRPVNAKIYYKYRNTDKHVGNIAAEANDLPPGRFKLNLKSEKQKLKKDLIVELKWNEPIDYFIYIVTGRANIVKAERVEVPKDSKSFTLKIVPTLEMVPEAKILVQYIYNDNLRFEEETIYFENDFQNTLKISTVAQASPGDDIELKILTDPYSYVGLLGVDLSVLLLGSYHDIKKDEIFHDLEDYKTYTPTLREKGRYPGKLSGLVTLTNAHFPLIPHNYYAVGPAVPTRLPRTRFPETWIFENFDISNQTQFSVVRKIPDTITSWVITGFSINSKTGIALTEKPTKIQVFKPFFVSINLPYSVKEGEVISIAVLVFNYMNETIDAEVIMDNSDEEYEFVEATNEVEERRIDETKRCKRISLPSDDVKSVSFMIKPKTFGITLIKVTALTAMAGDIVHRKLRVEPEGVTEYKNSAYFVNLSKTQEQMETIMVDVPNNVVPNTEHVQFSAIGDLVGLSIKYIENLVRLPVGTGEQNMIHFVPSVLVLRYLKAIRQEMPNITKSALNTAKIGFQREMNFRHNDGSFSTYGRSDRSDSDDTSKIAGSTWLTAYVVKYFQQASEFIDIFRPIMSEALEFLASKQTTSGNFAEYGYLLEFPHMNDASLTAFVLLSFMEKNEYFSQYETHVRKGITFLITYLEDTDDVYSLSMTALILQIVRHPLAEKTLTKLKSFAKNENGLTWWSVEPKKQKRQLSRAYKSSDIEITSYALQAMLRNGTTEDWLPVIKWLTKQRNSNGGFMSTQDTVVGLEALIRFAAETGLAARTGATEINYACEGIDVDEKGTIMLMPESSLMLSTHELPKNTRKVAFTAKGNNSLLVQLSYSYNTIDKEPEPEFRLNIIIRANTSPNKLIIDICAQFVPSDADSEESKTNMVVIEAALPSGFKTDREILEKIRDFRTVIFTETKKSDTTAIVYLHSLEAGNKKCIWIEATKEYEVAKQKPAPVVLYDYSNRERSTTAYYEIKSSLCDICEGDDCASDCRKVRATTEVPSKVTKMDV